MQKYLRVKVTLDALPALRTHKQQASSEPEPAASTTPAPSNVGYTQPNHAKTNGKRQRQPTKPKKVKAPPPPEPFMPAYIKIPAIEPASSLTVELQLKPVNPYRGGEFTYWVLTHQPTKIVLPSNGSEKSVRKVTIRPRLWIFWVLSLLLSVLAVILSAALVGWGVYYLLNVIF